MVKAGAKRAAKFALKFDAYVNMIRSKHERFLFSRYFMETTYMQYLIDKSVQDISSKCSLGWGSKANLTKYIELYTQKGKGTLEDFIKAGLNECAFIETEKLPAKFKGLFYVCTFPRSQLISTLSILPLPNEVPLTLKNDWLNNLTLASEHEVNILVNLPNSLSILNAQVCAHNVAPAVIASFQSASVSCFTLNLAPQLSPMTKNYFTAVNSSPPIAISNGLFDVGILGDKLNISVAIDIYPALAPIINPYVQWIQWGAKPLLNIAVSLLATNNQTLNANALIGSILAYFTVQNLTLTMSNSVSNQNVNNSSPILNSSVVKTP